MTQALPTFAHAIASLDAETPADWDAYLHCVSLVARIFGKTEAEVHAAVKLHERMNRQRILAEKDILTDAEKAELRVLSDQLTEAFCPQNKLSE